MRIQGKLYNTTDKEPVMFANIYVSDSKGTILPAQKGVSSDTTGAFVLDNVDPLGYVTISAVSIGRDVVKASSLPSNGGVAVYNKNYSANQQQIPTVTVRPRTKASASNPTSNKPLSITPADKNKNWVLPTVIGAGLLVVIGFGLAIRRWL